MESIGERAELCLTPISTLKKGEENYSRNI